MFSGFLCHVKFSHALLRVLWNFCFFLLNSNSKLFLWSVMSSRLRGNYSGSSAQETRLLLLGNLGCGKTSSADTILGQPSSGSHSSPRSCQLRQGLFEDRSVILVEAPRWFWSGGQMEDSVKKETVRAMTLLAPGPHCILLLVPVCQFTEVSLVLAWTWWQ